MKTSMQQQLSAGFRCFVGWKFINLKATHRKMFNSYISPYKLLLNIEYNNMNSKNKKSSETNK